MLDHNEILHRAEIKLAKAQADLREIRHGVRLYTEPDRQNIEPFEALSKIRQIVIDLATVAAQTIQARVDKEHSGDYSDNACIREIYGIGVALKVVKLDET